MNPERLRELAAINAVGGLDGEEMREFDRLMASAPADARAEVAALNNTAALIGAVQRTVERPSPALKAKIISHIAGTGRGTDSPFYFIRRNAGEWKALPVPGVRCKDLAEDVRRGFSVKLYELAPGTRFPAHHHSGAEECFVLSGDFHVQGSTLQAGDFHHSEAETTHDESFTVGGCQLLIVAAAAAYK
ncbi:MAG TPA: cupin domain-containing protein [Verrucomicrobiae bacterium]|nr:cupin domain-containing protein [Verrucomicrobiae bacterium]